MRRLFVLAALLFPAILLAHHSLAAEFDTAKPVVLHGRVTKVEWMNPHVFIWVDVPAASGIVTNWTLESVAPNFLSRLGLTKQSMKVGDTITVRAFVAKDQANLAKTESITLADGRLVATGIAGDRSQDVQPRTNRPK